MMEVMYNDVFFNFPDIATRGLSRSVLRRDYRQLVVMIGGCTNICTYVPSFHQRVEKKPLFTLYAYGFLRQ